MVDGCLLVVDVTERCRILGMVDGCLLVVDVTEGPMAQTRYVLSKALAMGLHPLVVFNKIDRPTASQERCDLVHSELFDLFSTLGAGDSQLDFPVLYASGAQRVSPLCHDMLHACGALKPRHLTLTSPLCTGDSLSLARQAHL